MTLFFKDNKKYQIILNSINSLDNITINNLVLNNDIFEKYSCDIISKAELIITNDVNKTNFFLNKMFKETFEEYLNFIQTYDKNKDIWIYNIINGISEQDNILFQDELFLIIPSFTWNNIDIDKIHILAIPKDTKLRSIRSLTGDHIELLNYIKNTTLSIIKKIYNIDEDMLKIFIHYAPSTYHLHIHFINIQNTDSKSSVEYSHELNNVIFNLELSTNYYQNITLNKRI